MQMRWTLRYRRLFVLHFRNARRTPSRPLSSGPFTPRVYRSCQYDSRTMRFHMDVLGFHLGISLQRCFNSPLHLLTCWMSGGFT